MTGDGCQNRYKFQTAPYFTISLAVLLLVYLAILVILCWVPPVSRDALTHHLAVPKLYLEHGGIYEIPSIPFSYYPMNVDLLYIIPLYLGSDIAAKYVHLAFALLTAWFIFSHLKARLGLCWAMPGVLLFLSLPVIVKLSITVYVDLGLIFFSTASLLCFLRWIDARYRLKYLIWSGIFCGLTLGTKYNGLIVFFLLTLFVPFVYLRREASSVKDPNRKIHKPLFELYSKALRYTAAFGFIALVVFSPWAIRNIVWTNNPVYPLYRSWFNSAEMRTVAAESIDDSASALTARVNPKAVVTPFLKRKVLYQESALQTLLVPLRIFFQGKDDDPQYFDGKLNPYLFILPLLALCFIQKDPAAVKTEKLILFAFAGLYLIFTFFKADMRMRYIAPIIPPLVILSVYGLHAVVACLRAGYSPPAARLGIAVVIAVSVVLFLPNVFYLHRLFNTVDPYSYIGGRISRDAYIEKHRPEYPAFQYVNSHLDREDKILGLFIGKRRYYSDREIIFDADLFRQVISAEPSAEMVALNFRGTGITHLLVRYDIFQNWSAAVFNGRDRQKIRDFFNTKLRLLFSKGGYGLYRLKYGSNNSNEANRSKNQSIDVNGGFTHGDEGHKELQSAV